MKKKLTSILMSMVLFFSVALISYNDVDAADFSRLYGSDRYGTSKAISSQFSSSNVAIVVTGKDYPDALSATSLAKKYNAPIILTDPASLNSNAESELKRLKTTKVYIIGGVGAVSTNAEKSIKSLGISTERVWGDDRYTTAVEVAKKVGTNNGIFVATGSNYADALSVGPIAANLGMPIVLVGKDSVSTNVNNLIKSNNITKSYVVGGTSVISNSVANKFPNATRIAGANRYATNSSIIKTFKASLDFSNAYVATGYNFPDALSGGALAALNSNPIVLTSANIEQETKDIIRNNDIEKITILGGTTVISDATANKLNTQISNGDVDENTHVWIANTSGTVYHDSSECSNMKNPIKIFLKDARLLKLNPCSKCNPPR
ncbi:MAG TPA: hypothetical protein DCR69_09240 [Clostridium sp.]|nr:hypothetical protein [Clostridium sp.]